jgi:hypothetical protein
MSDDGVTVTEDEPRPPRPDNTEEQERADKGAEQTVMDLNAGIVSRSRSAELKRAAKRLLGAYDLRRGIGQRRY